MVSEDKSNDGEDDYTVCESATLVDRLDRVAGRGSQSQVFPHRTIKAMDKTRYRDTVGAWRSMPTDPRVQNIEASTDPR